MRSIGWPSETLHDFRQEPRPSLGLINPDLDHAGGRHVIVFFASFMCRTEIARQSLIIRAEFCQHLFRVDAFVVIVLQTRVPGDSADRATDRSPDCPRTVRRFM